MGTRVEDDYDGFEALPDQTGADAVLSFTFASDVRLVLVESAGADLECRVSLDPGVAPTASLGVRVSNSEAYLPTPAITVVQVFAPAGARVCVSGWRRTA